MLIEWVSEPSLFLPVTTTLYLPAAAVFGTDSVIVVVADTLYFIATEDAARLAVTPVSAAEDK